MMGSTREKSAHINNPKEGDSQIRSDWKVSRASQSGLEDLHPQAFPNRPAWQVALPGNPLH